MIDMRWHMDIKSCTPRFLLSLIPLMGSQVMVSASQFRERVDDFGGEAAANLASAYRPR